MVFFDVFGIGCAEKEGQIPSVCRKEHCVAGHKESAGRVDPFYVLWGKTLVVSIDVV